MKKLSTEEKLAIVKEVKRNCALRSKEQCFCCNSRLTCDSLKKVSRGRPVRWSENYMLKVAKRV